MDRFETADYRIKMLDFSNKEELREVQKLRYEYLLKDFDENKNEQGGLDDDGWDEFSDSILAVDKKSGRIVGTYRVATLETLKGKPFKSEEEFDISALKADPDGFVEAGRAVVHENYRAGGVIGILWKGLIFYAASHGLRYIIGTASLHGTDPGLYVDCTSVLNQYYVSDKFEVRAVRNSFEYGTLKDVSMAKADMPGLLRAYLNIGSKVSQNGYIDYEFNSCDVMIIMDRLNMNERYIRRFLQ